MGLPGGVGQSNREKHLSLPGFAATAPREAYECVLTADGDIILFLLVRDTKEARKEKGLVGEQRRG